MDDMIIGKGTCLINCPYCGTSMLDGALHEHICSGDCNKISTANYHHEKHSDIERRLKKLESLNEQ